MEMFQNNKDKEGAVQWPSNEVHYLYVKEPSRAQLALTVFDEEVMAADIPLGATVRPLVSIPRLLACACLRLRLASLSPCPRVRCSCSPS